MPRIRFIDLRTHSINSIGVDSPKRLIEEAKLLGIKIGICDGIKYSSVASGIILEAKSKRELRRKVSKAKSEYDYILFDGGDEKKNRLGVSLREIDILINPGAIDTYTARLAAKNEAAIEISLRDLIHTFRGSRVKIIKAIDNNLMLSRKYGFSIIVTSGARSRYELRNARETFEVLRYLGFKEEEALSAMFKTPKSILKREKEEVKIIG